MKRNVIVLALFIPLFSYANNSHTRQVTVAEAKTMHDDANVMLKGQITGYAGDDDKYWFSDGTGKIRIDVDDDDVFLIGKHVHIVGDIDKDNGKTEIDVDHVVID